MGRRCSGGARRRRWACPEFEPERYARWVGDEIVRELKRDRHDVRAWLRAREALQWWIAEGMFSLQPLLARVEEMMESMTRDARREAIRRYLHWEIGDEEIAAWFPLWTAMGAAVFQADLEAAKGTPQAHQRDGGRSLPRGIGALPPSSGGG